MNIIIILTIYQIKLTLKKTQIVIIIIIIHFQKNIYQIQIIITMGTLKILLNQIFQIMQLLSQYQKKLIISIILIMIIIVGF